MTDKKRRKKSLPDIKEFCLNIPLYESFKFNKSHQSKLNNIRGFSGNFDCFCIDCNQTSVFQAKNTQKNWIDFLNKENYIIGHWFFCSRNEKHLLFFLFRVHKNTITKIGQYPSLADLATVEIQSYRKVLGNERFREFSRSVGLASHGVGIGAFVYLRRIFESLIEEAHQNVISARSWNEEAYQGSRMDEKIKLLSHYLPEFLVKNKALYSILSKGIHELNENECLNAFPIIKLGIVLILDEKLKNQEREEKIKQANEQITKLKDKFSTKKA